jgi:hypothetical protein
MDVRNFWAAEWITAQTASTDEMRTPGVAAWAARFCRPRLEKAERTGMGGVTLGRQDAEGMGGAGAGKELDEDVEGKMRRTDYGQV